MAHSHGGSFVNRFRVRVGNDLLKIWIVADRVPDGIAFQTRNGNELTGWACDQLANYFHGVLGPRPTNKCLGGRFPLER
jgi:hypothetical protein